MELVWMTLAIVLPVILIALGEEQYQKWRALSGSLCKTEAPTSFTYRGKTYDRDKFIGVRAKQYVHYEATELVRMVRRREKKLPTSSEPDFLCAEIEALKLALAYQKVRDE